MKNNIWIGYAVFVLVVTAATVGGVYIVHNFESQLQTAKSTTVTNQPAPPPLPSQYPDFDSLSSLHELSLANNFQSWTPTGTLDQTKLIAKIIVQKGQLAKAYLFVDASINSGPLTQWESVYVKMNDVGGHLFRPLSLAVPPSNSTQLLFALNQIPYLPTTPYSELSKPSFADWFSLFQDKSQINLVAFISSLKPAQINKLSIYYECLNNDDSCNLIASNTP